MTFQEFQNEVFDWYKSNPNHRLGVHAWKRLEANRPDLAEEFDMSDADPYNDDSKLPLFWLVVERKWNAPQGLDPLEARLFAIESKINEIIEYLDNQTQYEPSVRVPRPIPQQHPQNDPTTPQQP